MEANSIILAYDLIIGIDNRPLNKVYLHHGHERQICVYKGFSLGI
jgi:hypothetical protein